MQTILGSTGSIGMEIAKELPKYTENIRLVSRNPQKVNAGDELFQADLLSSEQTSDAVKGSDITYLTISLKYDHAVWEQQWPKIMENVIEACKRHNSKLVFFDNVYMYGKVDGAMIEETPHNPASKKGKVRSEIAKSLQEKMKTGEIKAVIARAADFYGKSELSMPWLLVFDKFAKEKKAQWLADADRIHSFTFIPDAGKATALLGNSEKAFGQIWHLPTDSTKITGKDFIQIAAAAYSVKPDYKVISKNMLKFLGLFSKTLREITEMIYQNEMDYFFDSSKFDSEFDFDKTSYKEGIRLISKI